MLLFQSGDKYLPVDDKGKWLLDTVDFCDTWEVSTFQNNSKANRGRENQIIFLGVEKLIFTHRYLLEWEGKNALLKCN